MQRKRNGILSAVANISTAELELSITNLCADINAATYRQLVMIAKLDTESRYSVVLPARGSRKAYALSNPADYRTNQYGTRAQGVALTATVETRALWCASNLNDNQLNIFISVIY